MKLTYLAPTVFAALAVATNCAHPAHAAPVPASPETFVNPNGKGVLINAVTRNDRKSEVEIALASAHKASVPIVVSDKSSEGAKALALELKKYLDEITGASFEIQTGDGTKGIVVGTWDEFPIPELRKPLEIVNGFDGREAFAIRTSANRLLLLGATERGASHAVYRFLEELGCRWFFPGARWEVIPRTDSLKWARDITDRPEFLARDIWFAWSLGRDKDANGETLSTKTGAWQRHNAMGKSFSVNAGHALQRLRNLSPENKAAFAAHPEYLALTGGQRKGPQLEFANPAVRRMIVDYAVDYFKKNPDADMVSIDPADGGGFSESEESKALGTPGDAIFGVANEVAKALQKAYPGQNKMVGLYAYNWHSDPPPFELEPNVYIQLTMGFNGGKLSLTELFQEWPKKTSNLGFYEYYGVWLWDGDSWPGGRIANKNYAINQIRRFAQTNRTTGTTATSISAESAHSWIPNGRGYYLASKLMWNSSRDADAILEDFYSKAFGPAAPAMKKYYALSDDVPLLSPGVYGTLFRAVDEADKLAKNRPDVLARLQDYKKYLHWVFLPHLAGREKDQAKRSALAAERIAWAYRTRTDGIIHWGALSQNGAKKVDEALWKIDTPVTDAEVETNFQKALAFFPEQKIPTRITFSSEVAPVRFEGEGKAFVSPSYQGTVPYWFYSDGKPLEMKITPLSMYGGDKHRYIVRDLTTKKEVASGKLEVQRGVDEKGEKTFGAIEFKIPVPRAGLYELEYKDGASTWGIEVPASQIWSVPLREKVSYTSLYRTTPAMYFYVPKGTKSIEYYFAKTPYGKAGAHNVVGPDGSVQKFVEASGDYVSVPVPAGMDGKVWSFDSPAGRRGGQFALGLYVFYNIPNLLSGSPATMLIPKDVIEKDGLKAIN